MVVGLKMGVKWKCTGVLCYRTWVSLCVYWTLGNTALDSTF